MVEKQFLLPFPAESADCGSIQGGLSFSRNTEALRKAGKRGEAEEQRRGVAGAERE